MACLQVESSANRAFVFKTHPNIDKNLYSDKNILGLKDPSRPFPTGNPLGILKWRMQSKQDSLVPLSSTWSWMARVAYSCLLLLFLFLFLFQPSVSTKSGNCWMILQGCMCNPCYDNCVLLCLRGSRMVFLDIIEWFSFSTKIVAFVQRPQIILYWW